jgi:glycosyltransferase involved in cell wall biosynthesis
MSALAVIDVRDGFCPQLRGWGGYARSLTGRCATSARPSWIRSRSRSSDAEAGLEVAFEQITFPLPLRRRQAALVHATNCFLPLAGPCPGAVTIHDLAFGEWPEDFQAATVESYILAVGDPRQKKNLSALVSAHARLWEEGASWHRLVLAGIDRGEGPRLAELARGAPTDLTGYLSDERLDAVIRGAVLLVHPGLYEGFGLVALEAMARGTPVLAARAGALPETGGQAAAYFDAADPDSLQRELGALLADASARSRLAEAALAWAARFSWRQAALETVSVYRELG